jgi:hypothetical protein
LFKEFQVHGIPTPPRRAAPNLVANFLPVRFFGQTFRAGVLTFEAKEQLAGLREELKDTHAVRRDGDRIVCVPLVPKAPEVGEQEKFAISDHRELTMRLVREALVREVIAMRYKLRSFGRPSFISRYAAMTCSSHVRARTARRSHGCTSTRSTRWTRGRQGHRNSRASWSG